jgi:hypothetical protein
VLVTLCAVGDCLRHADQLHPALAVLSSLVVSDTQRPTLDRWVMTVCDCALHAVWARRAHSVVQRHRRVAVEAQGRPPMLLAQRDGVTSEGFVLRPTLLIILHLTRVSVASVDDARNETVAVGAVSLVGEALSTVAAVESFRPVGATQYVRRWEGASVNTAHPEWPLVLAALGVQAPRLGTSLSARTTVSRVFLGG